MKNCKNNRRTAFPAFVFSVALALTAGAQPADAAPEKEPAYDVPPVRVTSLKRLKKDAVGLLLSSDGKIMDGMLWNGALYDDVARRIRRTETRPLSASEEFLRRRVLLMAAEPPQGTPEGFFIKERLNALYRRGYFQNVEDMISQLPPDPGDLTLAEIAVNTAFMRGNTAKACALVKKNPDEGTPRQKQSLICAAAEKDENKMLLLTAILNEQREADAFLSDAADALMADKIPASAPKKPSPLNLFLLRHFQKIPPASFLKSSDVAVMSVLTSFSFLPDNDKIVLTEKLVEKGVTPGSVLADLYKNAPAETNAATVSAPMERARLFRETQNAANDEELSEKLDAFLASARAAGVFTAGALASKQALNKFDGFYDISVKTATPEIVKALAINGDTEKTRYILSELYQTKAPLPAEAQAWYVAEAILPEQRPLLPRIGRMMAHEEKSGENQESTAREADRLMLVFETLGKLSAQETWAYTSFPDNSAEAAFLAALHKNEPPAGAPASTGEKILEALEHEDGSFVGFLETLRRLKAAGLHDEARRIAAERLSSGLSDMK